MLFVNKDSGGNVLDSYGISTNNSVGHGKADMLVNVVTRDGMLFKVFPLRPN